jgi:hypothetical protein
MIHYFNFTESNLVEANVVKKTDLEEINADKSKKIFQENFAPFHGRSKWLMIILFSLLVFYLFASNIN